MYSMCYTINDCFSVDPSQMIVTWSTQNYSQNAVCYYGAMDNPEAQKAAGTVTKFTDPHSTHTQYIHRVVLSSLKPDTKYCKLHVGMHL